MSHEGQNLDFWQEQITNKSQRFVFAVNLLHQLIVGLKKIHELGYAHCDLKPDNICARRDSKGSLRFSLIDLGLTTRLLRLGEHQASPKFRGNLMYASPMHLKFMRTSEWDDIYSLMCVVLLFIHQVLPWISYLEQRMCDDSNNDNIGTSMFKLFRIEHHVKFNIDLIKNSGAL